MQRKLNFASDIILHRQHPSHARSFGRSLLQLLLAPSPGNFHSEVEVIITKCEWWCAAHKRSRPEISTTTTASSARSQWILSASHNFPAKLAASTTTTRLRTRGLRMHGPPPILSSRRHQLLIWCVSKEDHFVVFISKYR